MPDRDWWVALWPDPAGTLLSLGIRSGMTVVDLCCGDGFFTGPLAKIVSGHVYALDPQDGTMAPPQELELGADVLADPFVLPSGEVLIATTGGELVRIDPAKLEIVSRTKLGS